MKNKAKTILVMTTLALAAGSTVLAKIQMPFDSFIYCDHPRLLNFSLSQSAGNLFMRKKPDKNSPKAEVDGRDIFKVMEHSGRDNLAGLAQGPVKIPANTFVTLKLGTNFFQKPDLLSKLPADAIDCLIVSMLSMDDSEDKLCDDSLGHLNNLTGLQAILLDRSDVTDEGMSKLGKLVNITYISAFLTNITGNSLKDLSNLKKLKFLSFHSTPVDGKNLVYLANFPQLAMLDVTRTGIDSNAVKHIAKCPNLISLDMSDNARINDSAVPYIATLKKLKHLNIGNTSITFNGLKGLKGLTPRYLALPHGIAKSQFPAIQAIFPGTMLAIEGNGGRKVDDETGTIFGVMSRDRKIK